MLLYPYPQKDKATPSSPSPKTTHQPATNIINSPLTNKAIEPPNDLTNNQNSNPTNIGRGESNSRDKPVKTPHQNKTDYIKKTHTKKKH